MRKAFWMIFLGVLIVNQSCGKKEDEEAEKYLLPKSVEPSHYNVEIAFDMERFDKHGEPDFRFDGRVDIIMESIADNVTEVVLNYSNTTRIKDVVLRRKGLPPTNLGTGRYDARTQKIFFDVPGGLRKREKVALSFAFAGEVTRDVALGVSSHEKNGKRRFVVFSDLEPIGARTIFPCFDEPKYKTTFNVSVGVATSLVADGYSALSNAPEISRETRGDWTIIHFARREVIMSIYLLAVVVSDYKPTEAAYFKCRAPEGCALRTWGPPALMDNDEGRYPQTIARAVMDIYADHFSPVHYPLPKMDQVGIEGPGAYGNGAMENWGLVTYYSSLFMGHDSLTCMVIAHELAHQWFGNLVTLHWWSDIWLNEGFATYFQHFGISQVNETWDLHGYFLNNEVLYKAMSEDIPESYYHPLTVEVYDPELYEEYFDTLEYSKGAAVIHMWRNIFGEEAFMRVLRDYLYRNAFTGVEPRELKEVLDAHKWESESDFGALEPNKVFKDWHLRPGFPLVNVRSQNATVYVLSQEVFRMSRKSHVDEARWTIPVSLSTSKHSNFNVTTAEHWLGPDGELCVTLPEPVDWIVVNNQVSGYYRVNYNVRNWKALFHVLHNESTMFMIHPYNRMQIVSDATEIARSTAFDYLPYNTVLEMLSYLKRETDFHPWLSAFHALEYLKNMLAKDEGVYQHFKVFVLDLLSDRFDRIDLDEPRPTSVSELKFREKLVSWACEMEHPKCLCRSKQFFDEVMQEKRILSGLFGEVTCSIVRNCDENGFVSDQLWQEYLKSESVPRKKSLLRGLGCSRNSSLLQRLLERAVDGEHRASKEERTEMFTSVLNGNPENAAVVLRFIADHTEKMAVALREKRVSWSVFVALAERLCSDEELDQILKIKDSVENLMDSTLVFEKTFRKVVRIIESNNEWLRVKKATISDWLLWTF